MDIPNNIVSSNTHKEVRLLKEDYGPPGAAPLRGPDVIVKDTEKTSSTTNDKYHRAAYNKLAWM